MWPSRDAAGGPRPLRRPVRAAAPPATHKHTDARTLRASRPARGRCRHHETRQSPDPPLRRSPHTPDLPAPGPPCVCARRRSGPPPAPPREAAPARRPLALRCAGCRRPQTAGRRWTPAPAARCRASRPRGRGTPLRCAAAARTPLAAASRRRRPRPRRRAPRRRARGGRPLPSHPSARALVVSSPSPQPPPARGSAGRSRRLRGNGPRTATKCASAVSKS